MPPLSVRHLRLLALNASSEAASKSLLRHPLGFPSLPARVILLQIILVECTLGNIFKAFTWEDRTISAHFLKTSLMPCQKNDNLPSPLVGIWMVINSMILSCLTIYKTTWVFIHVSDIRFDKSIRFFMTNPLQMGFSQAPLVAFVYLWFCHISCHYSLH